MDITVKQQSSGDVMFVIWLESLLPVKLLVIGLGDVGCRDVTIHEPKRFELKNHAEGVFKICIGKVKSPARADGFCPCLPIPLSSHRLTMTSKGWAGSARFLAGGPWKVKAKSALQQAFWTPPDWAELGEAWGGRGWGG